jgi:uncharacterized membrane protein HdeD (DUF308 family)
VSLLLAGFIVFHWPSNSLWAVGTLLGVSMLFSGIARLTWAMRKGTSSGRHQAPDNLSPRPA